MELNSDVAGGVNDTSEVQAPVDPLYIPFPNHFVRCPCVACGLNFDRNTCLGSKCSGRSCFCIEGSGACWKPIQQEKHFYVCFSGDYDLIYPQSCCALYQQSCCIECFCSSSGTDLGYRVVPVTLTTADPDYMPKGMGKSIVCMGLCCMVASCFTDYHSLFGCYDKHTCLCFECESISYRSLLCENEVRRPDRVCILYQGHSSLVKSCAGFKGVSQCLCVDRRHAFPCDDDVPCVFTYIPTCIVCASGKLTCCLWCKTIHEVATLGYPETTVHKNTVENTGNDTGIIYASVATVKDKEEE